MPWHDEPGRSTRLPRAKFAASSQRGRGRERTRSRRRVEGLAVGCASYRCRTRRTLGPLDAQPQLAHRVPGQECESEPRDQCTRVLALAMALAVALFSLTDGGANTPIGEAALYSDTNRPRLLPTISPVADLPSTEKLFPWQVKVPLATLSRRSVVSSSRGSASCFRVGCSWRSFNLFSRRYFGSSCLDGLFTFGRFSTPPSTSPAPDELG